MRFTARLTFALPSAAVVAGPSSLGSCAGSLRVELDLGIRRRRGHGGRQDKLLRVRHRGRRGREHDRVGALGGAGRAGQQLAAGEHQHDKREQAEQSGHPASVPSSNHAHHRNGGIGPVARPGRLGPWRSARRTRARWPVSRSRTSTSRSSTALARPRATWSPTWTPCTSGCSPSCGTARCPSSGSARTAAVHAEEPAEVRPRLDPDDDGLGERLEARGALPGLRRPADAGVARQPAGGRVPPGADAGGQRPADPPDPRPRPAGRRRAAGRVPDGGRGRAAGPAGARGRRAVGRRRRPAAPRACTCSCRSPRTPRSRTSRPATRALAARAAALDPSVATTEFVREERGGKVFVDSTRAGGATVVAAYSPRARPGVPVSFPVTLGRARAGRRRRLHDPDRVERLADGPVGRRMAVTADVARRPGRRGSRDPDRAGGRHARGQAAREALWTPQDSRHQAEAAAENASSPGGRAL